MTHRARWLLLIVLSVAVVSGCETRTPTPSPTPIILHFPYWGSEVEKEAVGQMAHAFEDANPGILVKTHHFNAGEYMTQLQAMLDSGEAPDVGYLLEGYPLLWASEGKVKDMTELFRTDPDLAGRLPETFYYYTPDQKTLGTNTAVEIILLFYNQDVFDAAGLPYPPTRAEEAWTWDEFVAVARQLTSDVRGLHPGDPGFDLTRVDVFGASFATEHWSWADYYAFIYSNGGAIVNDDGTRLMLDSPEALEAIQRLHDLMWVDNVAPTPAEAQRRPSADVQFQTGKVAMVISGQWKLLDYASMEGFNYGVAVLPKFKVPKTLILGSPTVIFANTQHPAEALKLYKFHNNPQQVNLFERGLWMPLETAYYTDPQKMDAWLNNAAHPSGAREAIADYTLCCVVRTPHYYVKNFGQIAEEVIQPAINEVWTNALPVAEAMARAVEEAQPLLQGRWDR